MQPTSSARDDPWGQGRDRSGGDPEGGFRRERRQTHAYSSSSRGPARSSEYSVTPPRAHDPPIHTPAPSLSRQAFSAITEHGRIHGNPLHGPGIAPISQGPANPPPQRRAYDTGERWDHAYSQQRRWSRRGSRGSESGSDTGDLRRSGIVVPSASGSGRARQEVEQGNSLGLSVSPPRRHLMDIDPPESASGSGGT